MRKYNKFATVYANANGTALTVSIANELDSKSQILIYSIDGKLIRNESMNGQTQDINIDSFSKGVYIIKIQNGVKSFQTKFIKS